MSARDSFRPPEFVDCCNITFRSNAKGKEAVRNRIAGRWSSDTVDVLVSCDVQPTRAWTQPKRYLLLLCSSICRTSASFLYYRTDSLAECHGDLQRGGVDYRLVKAILVHHWGGDPPGGSPSCPAYSSNCNEESVLCTPMEPRLRKVRHRSASDAINTCHDGRAASYWPTVHLKHSSEVS